MRSATSLGTIGSALSTFIAAEKVGVPPYEHESPILDLSVVPSRRDDMEALALMLIHLVTPNGLPWTRNGIPKDDEQHDRIVFEKLNARPDDLCYGLPSVFEEFLRYCRRLKFLDQPNYKFWRDQFAQLAKERGYFESDGRVSDDFIWPPRPEKVRSWFIH